MLLLWLGVPLVATACSFSSPRGSQADDGGDDDNGGDDDTDPPMCAADDDKDGVCNDADKCAGHDDRKDADTDGIADGCDDWPCGLKPNDPGGAMSDSGSEGRSWYAAFINIGNSRRALVTAGQPFDAQFTWSLLINCGGGQATCRAQAEFGYGAMRAGCLYDNNVSDEQLRVSTFDGQLTAPATPGVHELRLNAGRATDCGTGTSWYGGDPGPESTIAILCVRP